MSANPPDNVVTPPAKPGQAYESTSTDTIAGWKKISDNGGPDGGDSDFADGPGPWQQVLAAVMLELMGSDPDWAHIVDVRIQLSDLASDLLTAMHALRSLDDGREKALDSIAERVGQLAGHDAEDPEGSRDSLMCWTTLRLDKWADEDRDKVMSVIARATSRLSALTAQLYPDAFPDAIARLG